MRKESNMRLATKSLVAVSACVSSWLICYPIPASAQIASFECAKTAIPAEAAICRIASLGAKDVEMATLYRILVMVHPAQAGMSLRELRDDLHDSQTNWLIVRNACEDDAACLRHSYDRRINALTATITENVGLTYGRMFDDVALSATAHTTEGFKLVRVEDGDIACYVVLQTSKGEQSLMGDFELCRGGRRDASRLIGRRVIYTTKKEKCSTNHAKATSTAVSPMSSTLLPA
jgi:uncharacterized protein